MIPQIRRRSPRGEPAYFNDELIRLVVRRQRTDNALTHWMDSQGERISDEAAYAHGACMMHGSLETPLGHNPYGLDHNS